MEAKLSQVEFDLDNERKKVAALERSIKFYRERNERLCAQIGSQLNDILDAENRICQLDELLWWMTALAHQYIGLFHVTYGACESLLWPLQEMLATQGYTQENLEKR